MSTFGKTITGIIVFVAVATVVVVLIFVNRLDGLIESGVETYGSEYLKAPVQLDSVNLSIFDGRGSLRGLTIGNPEGFSKDSALSVDEVLIALNVDSLTQPVIVIDEISIEGAAVLVEQKGTKNNNLQTLMDNLQAATRGSESDSESSESSKELAIKEFNFTSASTIFRSDLVGEKQISIPDIQLTDLGTEKKGLGAAEATRRMMEPIVSATVKEAVGNAVRKEVDKLLDKNDKLKGLKSMIQGIGKPPSE